MPRYIDADEAYDDMLTEMAMTGYQSRALSVIKRQPTADVTPVIHAHWKITHPYLELMCSRCGEVADQKYAYCHCGAKMDGGEQAMSNDVKIQRTILEMDSVFTLPELLDKLSARDRKEKSAVLDILDELLNLGMVEFADTEDSAIVAYKSIFASTPSTEYYNAEEVEGTGNGKE